MLRPLFFRGRVDIKECSYEEEIQILYPSAETSLPRKISKELNEFLATLIAEVQKFRGMSYGAAHYKHTDLHLLLHVLHIISFTLDSPFLRSYNVLPESGADNEAIFLGVRTSRSKAQNSSDNL